MDHKKAEQSLAVEKYLLDEFGPEEREEFEEHFFSCEECAKQVKLGVAFMGHAKESLKSMPIKASAAAPERKLRRHWTSWFSPAFAVPALALMLGIVAFQNLIQLPAMHQELIALNAPAVMPSLDLKSGSARGEASVITAGSGAVFQLTIDIPDTANVAHIAELYDSSGQKLWALAIPESAPKEGLALKMPGSLAAGSYSLVVKQSGAVALDGASHYEFVLRRQ